MTDARAKILSAIRHKLNSSHEEAELRLKQHPRHTIPARVKQDLLTLFKTRAEKAGAKIHLIQENELQQALENYFQAPQKIKISDTTLLRKIDWRKMNIEAETGAAMIDDSISVTECLCAVAETGTLVLASSKASPTTLNFLPKTHIVILKQIQILASYEDAFDKIRQLPSPPRCVNFITGPSRTGDIEQKILIGAHGPGELIIFVIT